MKPNSFLLVAILHYPNISTYNPCFLSLPPGLGVILTSSLSFHLHISNIHHLRPSLTEHTASLLVHSLATSCIYYHNSQISPYASTHFCPSYHYLNFLIPPRHPSFSNSIVSWANSEKNSKSYCIHLRPSITLSILMCKISSLLPDHLAPSDPLPPSIFVPLACLSSAP